MGGKKKTKWRKLPLEEFTKENSPKQEEQPPTNTCRTDTTREENDFIPTYNGPPEVIQNYAEPYEYIDGIWYPTSCVVYNPGLFSNYMMPADTCYYYCTVPESGQMQDYMSVPYQEYTPALPKDTVYLLLPTQTIRPTQPVQNVAPEWQSRRRRRRYEGYAEYAVIPEKTSSSKTEIKDHSRLSGAHTRRNTHYNNFRRMSSFSETSSSDGFASEPSQIPRKPDEMKKSPKNASNEKGPSYINKEMSLPNSQQGQASKKTPEMCGVHSKSNATAKGYQTGDEKIYIGSTQDKFPQTLEMHNTNIGKFDQSDCPSASGIALEKENLNNSKKEKDMSTKSSSLNTKGDLMHEASVKKETKEEEIPRTDSQTSLPDIVSSSNKTMDEKLPEVVNSRGIHFSKRTSFDNENSKSPSPEASNTQQFKALNNSMEMELNKIQSLPANQANRSIYKLAYNGSRSSTDRSSNSRSRSPTLSPEDHIPCSYLSHEIIVHEAASDDEPGSEDVELLPHRYESESYLASLKNKNLYVNKLSLAVELLRTQESLPYDGEFKRIVGDNNDEPNVHYNGTVNLGFKRDSCSPEQSSLVKNLQNSRHYKTDSKKGITSSDNSNDSNTGVVTLEEKSVKEGDSEANETQDNTDELRRLGIRARRRFSPFPFNPCFCCVIM